MDKFFASGKIHHLIFFYQEPDTDVKDPGNSIQIFSKVVFPLNINVDTNVNAFGLVQNTFDILCWPSKVRQV